MIRVGWLDETVVREYVFLAVTDELIESSKNLRLIVE